VSNRFDEIVKAAIAESEPFIEPGYKSEHLYTFMYKGSRIIGGRDNHIFDNQRRGGSHKRVYLLHDEIDDRVTLIEGKLYSLTYDTTNPLQGPWFCVR